MKAEGVIWQRDTQAFSDFSFKPEPKRRVSSPAVLGAAAPTAAERVPGISVHHGNAAQAIGKSAVIPHHLQS